MQNRYQQLLTEVKQTIQEVDVQEVSQMDANTCIIIDVREDNEWKKGHLPHAIHVSRGILEGNIERVAPDSQTQVVVYCAGGGRSALAAESLQRMGYNNVASMRGGFGLWLQQGFPVATE